jgi:hypothetical protein
LSGPTLMVDGGFSSDLFGLGGEDFTSSFLGGTFRDHTEQVICQPTILHLSI